MVRKGAIGKLQKVDINIGDFPKPYDLPVETGHRTCVTCLLGLISNELERPIKWDPATQYFVNDSEAEKHYHRDYRDGYKL